MFPLRKPFHVNIHKNVKCLQFRIRLRGADSKNIAWHKFTALHLPPHTKQFRFRLAVLRNDNNNVTLTCSRTTKAPGANQRSFKTLLLIMVSVENFCVQLKKFSFFELKAFYCSALWRKISSCFSKLFVFIQREIYFIRFNQLVKGVPWWWTCIRGIIKLVLLTSSQSFQVYKKLLQSFSFVWQFGLYVTCVDV